MERQLVSSSNLHSVGYDPATSTLQVQFNNGRIYDYFEVPDSIHKMLMGAFSKGTYFDEKIKDKYKTKRVL